LAHSVVQIARSESVLAIWLCGEFVGRNVQLLRERAWFDIPIVYVNQHRAISPSKKACRGSGRSSRHSPHGPGLPVIPDKR
jgi:hypothetical protein